MTEDEHIAAVNKLCEDTLAFVDQVPLGKILQIRNQLKDVVEARRCRDFDGLDAGLAAACLSLVIMLACALKRDAAGTVETPVELNTRGWT